MVRLVTFEDPEVQASSRKEAIKKVKKILADTDDQVLLRNSISEFVGDITQSLFLFLLLSSFLCLDIIPRWKIKTDFWIHKSFGRSFVCTHPFCKRKTLEGAGRFCMLSWKSLVRDKIAVVWPKSSLLFTATATAAKCFDTNYTTCPETVTATALSLLIPVTCHCEANNCCAHSSSQKCLGCSAYVGV